MVHGIIIFWKLTIMVFILINFGRIDPWMAFSESYNFGPSKFQSWQEWPLKIWNITNMVLVIALNQMGSSISIIQLQIYSLTSNPKTWSNHQAQSPPGPNPYPLIITRSKGQAQVKRVKPITPFLPHSILPLDIPPPSYLQHSTHPQKLPTHSPNPQTPSPNPT